MGNIFESSMEMGFDAVTFSGSGNSWPFGGVLEVDQVTETLRSRHANIAWKSVFQLRWEFRDSHAAEYTWNKNDRRDA